MFYQVIFILVYWHWKHLFLLNWCLPWIFTEGVVRFFVFHVSKFMQFVLFAGFPTVVLGIIL